MVLEVGEAHYCASDGASPDEDEEAPSPVTLVSQGYQRDRGVRTSDVPVDSGMVPFAESLLPLAPCRESMIGGGGDVGHQHAEEIEDDSCRRPSVVLREAPVEEDDAKDDTKEDAPGM